MEITKLKLFSPLCYIPVAECDPFAYTDSAGVERLCCFDLDEEQYLSFEPDKEKILGRLVFGSYANEPGRAGENGKVELPGGNYLFVQKEGILGREDIIALAVEIQSEGLWQRLKPGKRLYLRHLFEDGRWVTQLFRPYS